MARIRWALLPLLLALTMGLGYAVLSLPEHGQGLQELVSDNIEESGVSNPVTAVLLNFRGYDTLLEMVVLLMALLGVWSLDSKALRRGARSGSVLDTLARLLLPLLILVAAYLLWAGAHAPGGAFQAGSVLGAAGVLLLLTGWRLNPKFAALPLRISLVAGCTTFLVMAVFTLTSEGQMLKYSQAQAGILILIIETMATISIGITLAALFFGKCPLTKKDFR